MITQPNDAAEPIVAVVVTFNRAALLRRLLSRLVTSTIVPTKVIVVDNASQDDTADVVRTFAADHGAQLPVEYHALPENSGGAGGFAYGMQQFCAQYPPTRPAWAWLMDDDGLPSLDCLERLLPHAPSFDFLGPAVVAEHDPTQLCFPIRVPGSTNTIRSVAALESRAAEDSPSNVLHGVVIPFNGVLLRSSLMHDVGVVRPEFFIWGDDVEYLWRCERHGARIGTITDAIFAHPATDDLGTPLMFGKTTYNHSPSDLKHYCMCRNNVVNLRTYRSWAHVGAFVVKTGWFYTVTKRDLPRLKLSARAIADGLRNSFNGHRRFLS